MVAMIRAGKGRLNRMRAQNPFGASVPKRFLMTANRVGPGDAVMAFTDLPTPSSLSDASRMSP